MALSEPQQHPRPEGFWAYGRYYGGWRPGKYMLPIDEVGLIPIPAAAWRDLITARPGGTE